MASGDSTIDKQSLLEGILDGSINTSSLDQEYGYLESYLSYINPKKAAKHYGKYGLKRYYAEALNIDLDYIDLKPKNKHEILSSIRRGLSSLINWTVFLPLKLFSKTYDYVLRKTNNHLAASATATSSLAFSLDFYLLDAYSYLSAPVYTSSAFSSIFIDSMESGLPYVFAAAAVTGAASSLLSLGLVGLQKLMFRTKKINQDELENDIRDLTNKFYSSWRKYEALVSNYNIEDVDINMLDAVYSMVTSKMSLPAVDIKDHDYDIIPSISKAIGKTAYPDSIIHHCPASIGGATIIPMGALGYFMRKHIYNFVFVNKLRAYAAPNYDFPVAHELAHASGHLTESMANAYAMRSMKRLNEEYPMQGYDLFMLSNGLAFAVGALKHILKDEDEFNEKLNEFKVPKFIHDVIMSDDYSYFSPVPQLYKLNKKFSLEKAFIGLYITGAYIAIKKLEKKTGESFY